MKINTEVWSFRLFRIVRTIVIVCFGLLLFRSENLGQFFELSKGIFESGIGKSITEFGLTMKDFGVCFLYILVIFGVELAQELGIDVRTKLNEQNLIFRWLVYLIIIFSTVIFGIYGSGYDASSFIYGGF